MIDDKKIKSAAQGYCDATYGTLDEHPVSDKPHGSFPILSEYEKKENTT